MLDILQLKEALAGIVGKSNVASNIYMLKKNSTDATGIKAKPILVVWPTNKKQVLKIIRLANKEQIPIVPRGGGSGLCGGAVAQNAIVLNMRKMNKIKIYKKQVLVQPGVLLDSLNKGLSKNNLFFPVQIASHKIATIGGMISTNAGGVYVLRFGRMMENVLELQVVMATGKSTRVKKNRLDHFCGTEGIMGIIVEAKLKVLKKIKSTSITIRETETIGEMLKIIKMFIAKKNLIACEFINSKLYRMLGFRKRYFLLLEYKGKEGGIKNAKKIKRFWRIRESCFDFLYKQGWRIITDPQLPIGKMKTFLAWCEENNLPAFGHIGHGIIHVHFRNKEKVKEMYKLVTSLKGVISGEHGFGVTKKQYLPYKMRIRLKELKKVYDSKHILNPGKVI